MCKSVMALELSEAQPAGLLGQDRVEQMAAGVDGGNMGRGNPGDLAQFQNRPHQCRQLKRPAGLNILQHRGLMLPYSRSPGNALIN